MSSKFPKEPRISHWSISQGKPLLCGMSWQKMIDTVGHFWTPIISNDHSMFAAGRQIKTVDGKRSWLKEHNFVPCEKCEEKAALVELDETEL